MCGGVVKIVFILVRTSFKEYCGPRNRRYLLNIVAISMNLLLWMSAMLDFIFIGYVEVLGKTNTRTNEKKKMYINRGSNSYPLLSNPLP